MKRMFEDAGNFIEEITDAITMTRDGSDNTKGSIGFKRYKVYNFDVENWDAIDEYILKHAPIYERCYNKSDLAQSIISDLLDESLIY